MTPALVTELKRLEREATPGPWEADAGNSIVTSYKVETDRGLLLRRQLGDFELSHTPDADLVVALRNSLPALLEAVETMLAALEGISDDGWYRNGFVPADEEQVRRYILMDQVNHVRVTANTALARVAGLLEKGREK